MKIILFLFSVVAAHAASSLSLVFPGMPVVPGGTVTAQVVLTQTGTYPSALQFSLGVTQDITAVAGAVAGLGQSLGMQFACSPINGGSVTCILYGGNGVLLTTGGTIANLTFTIAPTSLQSETIAMGNMLAVSLQDQKIVLTAASATFSFPVQSKCDLNGDGVVDLKDVQIVLTQALASGPTGGISTSCTSGDLNKDGACTVTDLQIELNAQNGGACAAK